MDWVPIVLITFKVLVLGAGMFYSIKWHHDQDKKKKNEADAQQGAAEHTPDASD
jgi:hypothetical protein